MNVSQNKKTPKILFQVLTLFPEVFPGTAGTSVVGKALNAGIWNLKLFDIRKFSDNKYNSVDDEPFGGGPGMIMKPDILVKAIDSATSQIPNQSNARLFCLSPRGTPFNQKIAQDLSKIDIITLICGRYEGIDERVFCSRKIEEISIGDFILSGGEQAALLLIDAVVRLLPDVVGDSDSLHEESFVDNLLEYPHYTRPKVWNNFHVPDILLSGNHEKIKDWRTRQAEEITRQRRPDLWQRYILNKTR